MRAVGIILQIGVTLLAVAFVVDSLSSWDELSKFKVFVLGHGLGTGGTLGVVYGFLRCKNKPKPTGTRYKGEHL